MRRDSALRRALEAALQWMSLFGLEPLRLLRLRSLPWFMGSMTRWKRLGGKVDALYPMLDDRRAQAGSGKGHYFHQDYWVARNPLRACEDSSISTL